VRQNFNMSKSLSTNLLYCLLVGTSVLALVATPAAANSDPLKSTNILSTAIDLANTTDPVAAAAQAEEIKPGDWAYQTLQSLNAKYNCGNTPTGERSLSRQEFSTSLDGCVKSIEQLVAKRSRKKFRQKPSIIIITPAVPSTRPEPQSPRVEPIAPILPPTPAEPEVSQADLDRLKQLVQSFRYELQNIDSRLRTLDTKTAQLKSGDFSNTTKLVGEAIFAVTGLAGDKVAVPSGSSPSAKLNANTILSNRVRLNFRSSFSGKDLLLVRLQSRNSTSFAGATSGTNMARLGFEGNEANVTSLHRLQYQLPISPQTKVFIEAVGSEFNDNVYTFNPEHQAAGTGSVTRFGRFNPIYRLSNEGAGLTIDNKLSPNLALAVGYAIPKVGATETASNPAADNGLFNGSNVIFSQLAFKPSDGVNFGLIYARSYHSTGAGISGNNGSSFANSPFGTATKASADHYSVLASTDLSKNLILSGWAGYTSARQQGGGGTADIWNYAVTLAARDFGAKGNTLGFVLGIPPKVTGTSLRGRRDNDTSLHLEAFYKYKLSDNLTITPGILVLVNPEHNAANPTEYLGTIRTTFNF
jgi:Carbohydrate-selective porin, OprB family